MTNDSYILSVKRNNQRLYVLALSFTKNHYDSEDIIQNVFYKLLKCKNDFENDEHIDKWLTRVCVNECKNHLKLSFNKDIILESANELYTFDCTQDLDVFNAVMTLQKKECTVTHLFYYEDLPISDIAKLLNIKQSAVKTRLYRARNKLKEILGDDWINE